MLKVLCCHRRQQQTATVLQPDTWGAKQPEDVDSRRRTQEMLEKPWIKKDEEPQDTSEGESEEEDSDIIPTADSKDESKEESTEKTWIELSQVADAALLRAEGLFENFRQQMIQVQQQESAPSETEQAEHVQMLQMSKALYEVAATHLDESRKKLDADLEGLLKEAKLVGKEAEVPEALTAFRGALDEKLNGVRERLENLSAIFGGSSQEAS